MLGIDFSLLFWICPTPWCWWARLFEHKSSRLNGVYLHRCRKVCGLIMHWDRERPFHSRLGCHYRCAVTHMKQPTGKRHYVYFICINCSFFFNLVAQISWQTLIVYAFNAVLPHCEGGCQRVNGFVRIMVFNPREINSRH